MRVTLDTNVLVASFVSRGMCHELLEHLVRHHHVVSSGFILNEFRRVLLSKLRIRAEDVEQALSLLTGRLEIVHPTPLDPRVSVDADDDWVLATALAGRCTCLITGDRDLLVLDGWQDLVIVKPAEFWAYESKSRR